MIRLLEPAAQELDQAIVWYNAQAPGLGDVFLIEVIKVFGLIERDPEAWHPLSESTRRYRMARFPYGIIHTTDGNDLLVIAVAHLHRQPNYCRDRKKKTGH